MAARTATERSPDGFTLIELILVVTLLGILSAGVIPIFNGTYRTVQSDHTVRDLAATVRFAQERAITDALEYRLVVDPEKNCYGLMRFKAMDDDEKVFEPIKVLNQEQVQLPAHSKIKASRAKKEKGATGRSYISFYPTGACDDAKIDVTNANGQVASVETSGGIGRLKVKQ